jgi:nickel/cobalt transporter (NicO) family protein
VSVGTMFPEIASGWFDTGAALLLIGLGLWTFSHARHLHAHAGHGPAQLHSHSFGQPHSHQRAATLVGAMHGLAGAAPTIVLLQLARQESLIQGMVFVTVFAIGTAIGMALYALATGYLAGRAALASERWARKLGQLTGVSTIAIGIIWLLR